MKNGKEDKKEKEHKNTTKVARNSYRRRPCVLNSPWPENFHTFRGSSEQCTQKMLNQKYTFSEEI